MTIHDVSFERDASVMGLADRLTFKAMVPRAARKARARAHRFRADEARPDRALRDPGRRIVVTPNGVDAAFSPATGDGRGRRLPALRRRDPAAQGPAGGARDAAAPSGLPLVVAGPEKEPELARGAARRRRRPARLRLDADELADLYRGAAALVFPSRYEGFGLPLARGDGVRHAGRRGRRAGAARGRRATPPSTPSDGDFGAAVDARARRTRRARRAAGLERAKLFSWAETARRTARRLPRGTRSEGRGRRRLARTRRRARASRCPRSRRRSTSSSWSRTCRAALRRPARSARRSQNAGRSASPPT